MKNRHHGCGPRPTSNSRNSRCIGSSRNSGSRSFVRRMTHHQAIRTSSLPTRVYPAFRPDKVFAIDQADAFQSWVERLEKASGHSALELAGLLDALRSRHAFFGSLGAKLSDHGLPFTYSEPCDEAEASAIYAHARSGLPPSDMDALKFRSFMLRFFGELDADANWTK